MVFFSVGQNLANVLYGVSSFYGKVISVMITFTKPWSLQLQLKQLNLHSLFNSLQHKTNCVCETLMPLKMTFTLEPADVYR